MSNKLEDLSKAQELAEILVIMRPWIAMIDLEYAKQAVEDLKVHASFMDSAAVLNPMYSPLKSDICRKQSEALGHLVAYVELLKEVDEMKKRLSQESAARDEIMQLFQ